MWRAILKCVIAAGLLGVGGCVADVDYDSPAYDYYGGRYASSGYEYDDYYGPGPWLYSGYPYYWRHRHHYDGGGWSHDDHGSNGGNHHNQNNSSRDRGSISSGRVPWDSPRVGGAAGESRSSGGSGGSGRSSGGGHSGGGGSGGGGGGGRK